MIKNRVQEQLGQLLHRDVWHVLVRQVPDTLWHQVSDQVWTPVSQEWGPVRQNEFRRREWFIRQEILNEIAARENRP